MNPAAVMDDLAGALESLKGLAGRTFAYPPNAVVPPAACVGWPDEIDYDAAMVRGGWSMTLPVLIVAGKSDIKSARDTIGAYLSTSGPSSVRAALDIPRATYDSARVVGKPHVEPVSIAGIDYLAAILDVAVTGRN